MAALHYDMGHLATRMSKDGSQRPPVSSLQRGPTCGQGSNFKLQTMPFAVLPCADRALPGPGFVSTPDNLTCICFQGELAEWHNAL